MELGLTSFLGAGAWSPPALAVAAEERGFTSLFLPEHTHLPVRDDHPPALVGGVAADDYRQSLDPLVSLAAAAAVTTRLRLGTGVLLVAQHDPIVLAKQVATLDQLSGGRVVLGIGFGWNRAEAQDHGVTFTERRAVAQEKVACLRALWTDDPAEYHGQHVELPPCWAAPKPVQGRVPVLIGGGDGPRLLEAVVDYADGWLPIGGGGLAAALPRLHRLAEAQGRDPASLRVVPFGTLPSAGKLEHFATLGITEVVLRLPTGPADAMRRQLDELATYVPRAAALPSPAAGRGGGPVGPADGPGAGAGAEH
jgi:probable F420-dependent oxidoreductase